MKQLIIWKRNTDAVWIKSVSTPINNDTDINVYIEHDGKFCVDIMN